MVLIKYKNELTEKLDQLYDSKQHLDQPPDKTKYDIDKYWQNARLFYPYYFLNAILIIPITTHTLVTRINREEIIIFKQLKKYW